MLLIFTQSTVCQEVSVLNYSVDSNGQVLLEVDADLGRYYLLQVRHHPDSLFEQFTSMTLGQEGTTTLTEPLRAYPENHYRVLSFPLSNPTDSDNDGIDDLVEFQMVPGTAPFNAAPSVLLEQGMVILNEESDFHTVAITENNTPWVGYLDDVEFTKFIIEDFDTNSPKLYFMNCNTFPLHSSFASFMGIDHTAPSVKKGQIMYNPSALANNGTLGAYTFNFSSNGLVEEFDVIQRTHELLAANMPFVINNLSYLLTENDEDYYFEHETLFFESRVPVLFDSDAYAGINYWGLNQAEGYGFFRLMAPGEVPNPKDIVLYESIPNVLPHVGGILTSIIQTPLSHVNLRAIQDHIPNAYIRDPLEEEEISELIGHYIYFKAGQSSYEIREATLEEVNAWYESIRPNNEQIPLLDLSHTSILPLDEINFNMHGGFGAKTANVATMRTFGFAPGTIPNGFGIPFYYYQQFMEYNAFFDEVDEMLVDTLFYADRNIRAYRLAQFRNQIEAGEMPQWMLDSLSQMHSSFPLGTSVRCRSSTNNEDLPEFSGAGLYDSKTHHPNEGHISKTIKEIFASLWNLRAFDEREFYRINHYQSSMGVLCHPNFEDELVNGVGVSTDPFYTTESTFYLNSQLGEDLITNPGTTFPEEMLVNRYASEVGDYAIIQYSSLIEEDTLLMSFIQLDLLRQYLSRIHDEFAVLYNAQNNSTFAMDIEFKITSENKLIIKQARPWVTFKPSPTVIFPVNDCGAYLFPNPATDILNIVSQTSEKTTIRIYNLNGVLMREQIANSLNIMPFQIDIRSFPQGVYFVTGLSSQGHCNTMKFIKQ